MPIPSDIASCTDWTDFSDSATLFDATTGGSTPANHGGIARAENKITAGGDVIQATAAARPKRIVSWMHGLDMASFDGTDDYLERTTSIAAWPATVMLIMDFGGYSNGHAVSLYKNSASDEYMTVTGREISGALSWFSGVRSPANAPTLLSDARGGLTLVEMLVNSDGSHELVVPQYGIQLSNAATLTAITADRYAIGRLRSTPAGPYFSGRIGEVLRFNAALSGADRHAMRRYMGLKWGIIGGLQTATVTLTIRDRSGNLRANATGLTVLFFDQADPALISAPSGVLTNQSTDGSGQLSVDIPNSALADGEIGHIWITNSDGTVSQHWAFSGPVAVSVA